MSRKVKIGAHIKVQTFNLTSLVNSNIYLFFMSSSFSAVMFGTFEKIPSVNGLKIFCVTVCFQILIIMQFQLGNGKEIQNVTGGVIPATEIFQARSSNLDPEMLEQINKFYNQNPNGTPFFCDQLVGKHYMVGGNNFCGGYSPNNCSMVCFSQNFTYFKCEGNICHCFSQF